MASNYLYNNELFSNDYQVFRGDRVSGRGGGVLIALKSCFNCQVREFTSTSPLRVDGVDFICIRIRIRSKNVYVVVVYFPPATLPVIYDQFFENLEMGGVFDGDFVLVGDFNVPLFGSDRCPKERSISNFSNAVKANQLNDVVNANNRCLDLVLCSESITSFVTSAESSLVPEDSHHPSLMFDIYIESHHSPLLQRSRIPQPDFRRANLPLLYDLIYSTCWDSLFEIKDVEDACAHINVILNDYFDVTVPMRTRQSGRFPSWFSPATRVLIKNNKRLLKLMRRARYDSVRRDFRINQKRLKISVREDYSHYVTSISEKIAEEPKKLFSYINNMKNKSRIPGSLFEPDGNVVELPVDIANAFANYFKSVFVGEQPTPTFAQDIISTTTGSSSNILSITHFTESEVLEAMSSLADNLTMGHDCIPSFLVKDCRNSLSKPLLHIFNLILQSSTFPKSWKMSRITPIHKSGKRNEIANYRGISIICSFAKVFEIIFHKRVYFHVRRSLSHRQHGFTRGKSTVTNLCVFTDFVSEALDNRSQVDTIFTDFSKAFDVVQHSILVKKISIQFGVGDGTVALITSYLNGRTSFVEYDGSRSDTFTVPSGVPQGSVLGPLLFLMFINDVVAKFDSNCLLFADDLKLFRVIKSTYDCHLLQNDLDILFEWCIINGLHLNRAKCRSMSFSRKKINLAFNYRIDSHILEHVDSFRDLGVVLDTRLSFNLHVDEICKKSHGLLGFLIRNTRQLNSTALVSFFNAFVRSVLEYCCVVFGPSYASYINSVENVQRKFLKVLYFRKHGEFLPQGYDYGLLLKEFDYVSLSSRRKSHQLFFLHKVVHGEIDDEDLLHGLHFMIPRTNSRSPLIFYLPGAHTRHYSDSPLVSMCRLANHVREGFDLFTSGSTYSLKKRIKTALSTQ